MSIWSSVSFDDRSIPDRDNYTGELSDPQDLRDCYTFDVATATGWHELIRFSVDDRYHEVEHKWVQPLLSIDEARDLIAQLETAIEQIEDRRERDANRP